MSDAEFVKAFDELHVVSSRRTLIPGRLGLRIGASYVVDVPGRDGYVYVSLGVNGERGQATAKDAVDVDTAVEWQQVWMRRENNQLVIREAEHTTGGGGGSTTLAALTDVDTTGVADGDILMYESASGDWIPFTPSGSTGDAPSPHALDSVHHSGTLDDSQAPQFLKMDGSRNLTGSLTVSGGVTIDGVDISAHAADPDAHHNRVTVGNTGLSLSTQVVSLNLATDPGLELSSGVRIKAYHGINRDSNGVGVKLKTTSGLEVDTNGLALADSVAGAGLTPSSKVFNVVAGNSTITVNANDLVVNQGSAFTWTAQHQFNVDPQINADLDFIGTERTITTASTTNLNINPGGDLVLNPAGQDVLPGGSILVDLGDYNRKWRTLFAAELYVETLVAQDVLATIGGRIMVAPTTTLIADVSAVATTIDVKHNNLTNGSFIMLMTAPGGIAQIEVMKTTSSHSVITGGYRYSVTRNLDGTGANAWVSGDAVVNLGRVAGEGYIDLTSTSTIHNHFGPTITIYSRTGTSAWTDTKAVVSMGNLESFVDYSAPEFGFAVGNDLTLSPATGFKGLTADRADGVRLFNTNLELYDSTTLAVQLAQASGLSILQDTDLGIDARRQITWYSDLATMSGQTAVITSFAGVGSSNMYVSASAGGSDLAYLYLRAGQSSPATSSQIVVKGDGLVAIHNTMLTVRGAAMVGSDNSATSRLHVYEDTSSTGTATGITVEQDGAGDAVAQFLLTGGQRWMTGIDNTDDAYKIAPSTNLGTNTAFAINASGNAGIGTGDIEAWDSALGGVHLGAAAALVYNKTGENLYLTSNAYFDGAWKRRVADTTALYTLTSGEHALLIGATGATDSAITWTTALFVNASSNAHFGSALDAPHSVAVTRDGASATLSVNAYGTGTTSQLILYSPRGTEASPTANQTGDVLGGVVFQGWDTARSSGGHIYAVASANWGTGADSSDNPTNLIFANVPDGSNTMTDRMIIDSTGNIGIDTLTPASRLHTHESNSATGSGAGVTVEQGSTGDSIIHWVLTGGQVFSAGIDNSDGDTWKVSVGYDLGTNTAISIDPATGNVTIVGLTIEDSDGSIHDPATAGDGIIVTLQEISVDATVVRTPATVVRDTRTIIAGAGLTGGGALSSNVTLDVNPGSGIELVGDAVTIDLATTSGLSIAGGLAIGAGDGIDVLTSTIAVDVTDFLDTAAGLTETSNNIQVHLHTTSGLSFDSGTGGIKVGAGAGISVLASTVAISLAATSGLNTSSGLAIGAGDGIDVLTATIAVDVTDFIDTTKGLTETTNNIQVSLHTTSGLSFDGGTGGIKVGAGDGIDILTSTIAVDVTDFIDTAAGLREDASNNIQVRLHTTSGMAFDGTSGGIKVVAANASISINAADINVNLAHNWAWTGNHGFSTGTVTFNTAPQVNANLNFAGSARSITSAANLSITPTGDLILDPSGNILLPNAQELRSNVYDDAVGGIQGHRLWNVSGDINQLTIGNIKADELHVRVFSADEVRISRGEQFWSYSYGIVETTFVTPADEATVNVWFENAPALASANLFVVNDWLLVATIDWSTGLDISRTWFQVVALVTAGSVDDYRQQWTIRRKSGGTTSNPITKGSIAIDVGQIGQGQIHLSALNASGGPYIQFGTFTSVSSDTPQFTQRVRIGHLSGAAGMSSGTWGFATGNSLALTPTTGYSGLISDTVNGLRLYNTEIALYESTNLVVDLSQSSGLRFEDDDDGTHNNRWIRWFDDLASPTLPLGEIWVSRASGGTPHNTLILRSGVDTDGDIGVVDVTAQHWDGAVTIHVDSELGISFMTTGPTATTFNMTRAGLFGFGSGLSTPVSVGHFYENTSSVGVTAGVTIEQDGSGDAVLQWLLTGGQRWAIGVDNSATGEPLKIAANADVGTSPALTITTGANFGIATSDIEAWDTSYRAIEFGAASALMARLTGGNGFWTMNNAYFDGAWKRKTSGLPTLYTQSAGEHTLFTAVTGAADSAITWLPILFANASRNVHFGSSLDAPHSVAVSREGDFAQFGANSYGTGFESQIVLYSSRGTEASPTATQSGDILGSLVFQGYDTARSTGARIYAIASAAWGTAGDSTDDPTDLRFATVPDGSNTLTDRMTITSDGNAALGTMTPGVDVVGTTDYGSTIRVFQVDGQSARVLIRGSANAALDLIDTSAGANLKWIQLLDDAGIAKFRSIDDAGGVLTENLLTMQHDEQRVAIGTATPGVNIAGAYDYPSGVSLFQVSGGTARVTVHGSTNAALDLIDSGASGDLRWMQIVTESGLTTFRSMTDAGVANSNNILVLDHNTGVIGVGTNTPNLNDIGSRLTVSASDGTAVHMAVENAGSGEAGIALRREGGPSVAKWTMRVPAGSNQLDMFSNTLNDNVISFLSDGHVGVHESTPGAWLDVGGDGASVATMRSTVYGATGAFNFLGRRTLGTKSSPSAVASGSVIAVFGGLGYTSGGFATNTSGEISITATEAFNTGTSGKGGAEISFWTRANGAASVSKRMTIQEDGALAVPYIWANTVTTVPNVTVDSSGILKRTTHVNSSLRYKKDVRPLAADRFGNFIKNLVPVEYKMREEYGGDDTLRIGFIAEAVLDAGGKEFIQFDEQGRPDALMYDRLVVPLVGATQQLIKDNNEDRKRIAWLERRLEELEKRLAA